MSSLNDIIAKEEKLIDAAMVEADIEYRAFCIFPTKEGLKESDDIIAHCNKVMQEHQEILEWLMEANRLKANQVKEETLQSVRERIAFIEQVTEKLKSMEIEGANADELIAVIKKELEYDKLRNA